MPELNVVFAWYLDGDRKMTEMNPNEENRYNRKQTLSYRITRVRIRVVSHGLLNEARIIKGKIDIIGLSNFCFLH